MRHDDASGSQAERRGRPARVILVCAGLALYGIPVAGRQAVRMVRVRWESPVIGRAIADGMERSSTFRGLVEAIDGTDGLVYVLEGTCGQGVRACLHMSVELLNGNRLLRIVVNPRRAPGCELIGSIGHELRHAIEALGNPNIKTWAGLSSFFHQIGPEGPRMFETPEAVTMGVAVERESCRKIR